MIARFYEIGRQPGQERFLKIGEALIEDRNDILKKLSEGMIELGGAEAMRLQQVLVQSFKNSFDAVSCRDLKFWADIGTDEISRNYFRLNLEALKRSDKVTRLLIFDDNEMARIDDVIKALVHHQRYGIAWAVVPYMDLDPSTREEKEDLALDFGLYDESEVAIYFRDYHSGVRKLRAVFPGPNREDFLVAAAAALRGAPGAMLAGQQQLPGSPEQAAAGGTGGAQVCRHPKFGGDRPRARTRGSGAEVREAPGPDARGPETARYGRSPGLLSVSKLRKRYCRQRGTHVPSAQQVPGLGGPGPQLRRLLRL